jgi:quinol monooxygenase YgiN
MNGSDPRIVVVGYLRIAGEDRDTLVEMLKPHVQRARKKDGWIAYTFAADALDPCIVRWSEVWRDLNSLETHLADDEFQAMRKETVKLRILERNVQRYRVSSTTDI